MEPYKKTKIKEMLGGRELLLAILLSSVLLNFLLIREGFFTNDEVQYYYMARAIAEKQSLDLESYLCNGGECHYDSLPWWVLRGDNGLFVLPSFGFPLVAAPFYLAFEKTGIQILNVILNTLSILLVYLLSKIVLKKEDYSLLAASLYAFGTFSIFYATSSWYHTQITFLFLLSIVAFLKMGDRRHYLQFFLISSAFCIWTAYYMILPLSILYGYLLFKSRGIPLKAYIALFFVFVFAVQMTYNYYVYSGSPLSNSLIMGYYGGAGDNKVVLTNIENPAIRTLYGAVGFFLCRSCVASEFPLFEYFQKSILESSAFVVFGFIGSYFLVKERWFGARFKIAAFSIVLYTFGIVYMKSGSFGSWEFSMRYLAPIMPFVAICSVYYVLRAKIQLISINKLITIIIVFSVISTSLPIFYFDYTYQVLIKTSIMLGVLVLLASLIYGYGRYQILNKLLSLVFIITIMIAIVTNFNDVRMGNEFRYRQNQIFEVLDKGIPRGSVLLNCYSFIDPLQFLEGRQTISTSCANMSSIFETLQKNTAKEVYFVRDNRNGLVLGLSGCTSEGVDSVPSTITLDLRLRIEIHRIVDCKHDQTIL